jgi:hypothetical protein
MTARLAAVSGFVFGDGLAVDAGVTTGTAVLCVAAVALAGADGAAVSVDHHEVALVVGHQTPRTMDMRSGSMLMRE